MTEEQIATTIAVLQAYADGTLRTDQCDELDEALVKAYVVGEQAVVEEREDESMSDMTGSMEWLECQDRD